jgi:hypothetical protein
VLAQAPLAQGNWAVMGSFAPPALYWRACLIGNTRFAAASVVTICSFSFDTVTNE